MTANDMQVEYAAVRSNTRQRQQDLVRVLFLQSQTYFGADSQLHGLLMRYFERTRVQVHAACNPGSGLAPSASFAALSKIPDLHLLSINFGPTMNNLSRTERLSSAIRGFEVLPSLARLALYIRRHKIGVIHGTEKPRDAFYGVLLAKATGAKSIIHMHVKCEDWLSPLVRWSLSQCDGVIGISQFVSDSVVAMGYSPDKVHTVLNCIDANQWEPATDGAAIRQEYHIPHDMPVLCIMARLFHWKGHSELLKALAIVKERVPSFRLLIVGEDDPRAAPGRGSYTAEVKALTRELGLTQQVIFTGFRSDVASLLAASDIYAMPSFEEPFGMVYLEAMAMGKPVIALDNGGTREVVEQHVTGLLSPPYDSDALAQNILMLLDNRELREQMGIRGRLRAERRFSPQQMADNVERVYRSILSSK
ncbi:MAG TPA: glycosyltransferase family 4 protein [Ktedonobacterales bacterium]